MTLLSYLPLKKCMILSRQLTKVHIPKQHLTTRVNKRLGIKLAPGNRLQTPREPNMLPGFNKALAFTVAVGAASYVGATIWQYESRKYMQIRNLTPEWMRSRFNDNELKMFDIRNKLNAWWNGQSEGKKIFWCILSLNSLVYGAWHYPPLESFMLRYFCSSPGAKAVCLPLILSNFSHSSLAHIFLNMLALHSFAHTIVEDLGKEQFVGFYFTAAASSSLLSHGIRMAKGMIGPSLGASGAIMGVFAFVCITHPDASLRTVFSKKEFTADSVIKFIMALDLTGLIWGWRLFDHAAHLGGAIFGILYASYGSNYLWQKRHYIIKRWKQFTE